MVRLAETRRRRESTEKAVLYTVIWNAQVGRRRGDRRRVSDFDAIARAESQEQARRWRKEHAAEAGSISDFINRNQRGKRSK